MPSGGCWERERYSWKRRLVAREVGLDIVWWEGVMGRGESVGLGFG